jgi:putative inorganic carbon (hco3(-)) transporter
VDILDTSLLLDGFSNIRTYGQFQTFTLPLLTLPLLLKPATRPARTWVFALLVCWWVIAICGGSRGTWLGMGIAGIAMSLCGPSGRRWLGWQLGAFLAGCTLYWCFFSVLPTYLGIKTLHFAGDRLTTNLSAREVIWLQAWDMIKARPWLGFGPMHFADIPNLVAAHPHQAILQWASEWGVPSALMVMGLTGWGLYSTLILIRSKGSSPEPVDLLRVCLFASLVGALVQSMVDGVIVMPYSQLWLCVVVGWMLAIHEWTKTPAPMSPAMARAWQSLMLCAVLVLMYVVIRDFPHLEEREQRYGEDFGGHFQPRFWMQGVIAIKPN